MYFSFLFVVTSLFFTIGPTARVLLLRNIYFLLFYTFFFFILFYQLRSSRRVSKHLSAVRVGIRIIVILVVTNCQALRSPGRDTSKANAFFALLFNYMFSFFHSFSILLLYFFFFFLSVIFKNNNWSHWKKNFSLVIISDVFSSLNSIPTMYICFRSDLWRLYFYSTKRFLHSYSSVVYSFIYYIFPKHRIERLRQGTDFMTTEKLLVRCILYHVAHSS